MNHTKCIADKYSTFIVKQLENHPRINGTKTLGENIADIGGNKIAYYAYQMWVKDNGDKGILPDVSRLGINSPNKLFWIRSAQRFCSTYRDSVVKSILSDPNEHHTILGFRNNGSAMFSAEFAKDFNCSIGSPMSPNHTCSLGTFWREILLNSSVEC